MHGHSIFCVCVCFLSLILSLSLIHTQSDSLGTCPYRLLRLSNMDQFGYSHYLFKINIYTYTETT